MLAIVVAATAVVVLTRTCAPSGDEGSSETPLASRSEPPAPHARVRDSAAEEQVAAPAPEPLVSFEVSVSLPEHVTGTVKAFPMPAGLTVADNDVDSFRPMAAGANPAVTVSSQGTSTIDVPAGPVLVVARAPGCAPAWRIVPASSADEHHARIELAPLCGVALRGVVLDEDGRPAPAVEVVASASEWYRPPCDALCARSRTDAQGRFELHDLAPGDHRLWVRRARGEFRRTDEVRVPAVGEIELRLVRGAHVMGRVVDDVTGDPVPGAQVMLAETVDGVWREGSVVFARARCDTQGRFELWSGVPDCDRARIVVDARGYARFPENDVFARDAPDRLDDTELDVEVRVARGATVLGTVRGTEGAVAGLHVHIEPKGKSYESAWGGLWLASTDSAGAYRIEGVPPGPIELTVRYENPDEIGGVATVEGEAAAGGVVQLDLTLHQGSPARGRIVDPAGTPISGALVTWSCGRVPGTTISSADGRFELPLPQQSEVDVDLVVRHPHWLGTTIGVSEEEAGDLADLVLQPRFSIRGRVLDSDGMPVVGAPVTVLAGEVGQEVFFTSLDSVVTTLSDAEGWYELPVSVRGETGVVATSPRDARQVFRSGVDAANADGWDLVFPTGTRLSGRVVDSVSGLPIEGVLVQTTAGSWVGPVVARTDSNGQFAYLDRSLPSGSIVFRRDGFIPTNIALDTLAAEPRTAVEVRMSRAFAVTGRVIDAERRPHKGATVELRRIDGQVVGSHRTDSAGGFAFRDVEAGLVKLVVVDEDDTPLVTQAVEAGARDVTLLAE